MGFIALTFDLSLAFHLSFVLFFFHLFLAHWFLFLFLLPLPSPFHTFVLLCHWEPYRHRAFILHMLILFIYFIFIHLQQEVGFLTLAVLLIETSSLLLHLFSSRESKCPHYKVWFRGLPYTISSRLSRIYFSSNYCMAFSSKHRPCINTCSYLIGLRGIRESNQH